ncbi:calcium-binding protein [Mangrovicoccus sp. HB161399]|uniref:calcium-binding protein n=1 Tax=Mangrovicoccus sp. HB161399 TaxID=2720392 RepID=UPI0015536715|nr:calcium-binding protein [Mangrovicoccus sp. HB161399]
MPSYSYSGTYISSWDPISYWSAGSYDLDGYANAYPVEIEAGNTYFVYEYDSDQSGTFAIEGYYVPVTGLYLDGSNFNSFDYVEDFHVFEMDWGHGYTSTILSFGDEYGQVLIAMAGTELPVFANLAEAQYFASGITAIREASGDWAPYAAIWFAEMGAGLDPLEGWNTQTGGPGDDVIEGTLLDETLSGANGDDEIYGDGGDDSIFGGGGDDYLVGGEGRDTINGGLGYDQVSYREFSDEYGMGVDVDLREGWARPVSGSSSGEDVLINIEMVRGSMQDDYIYGDGEDNILRGLDGADVLDGRWGSDTVRYDRDARYGGTAGVTVDLESHATFGDGDDSYVDSRGYAIDGWGNHDYLISIENATGTDSADVIYGNSDHNALIGLTGSDRILGRDGWDTIDGGNGHDLLFGGKGRDLITGGNGNDKLRGSLGFDTLDGGSGHDTLIGAKGDDLLTGGAGNDVFVFKFDFDGDTVTDFGNGLDRLDFSAVGAIRNFADLMANHVADGATGAVIDGGSGNSVTLEGVWKADLAASDFLF